MSAGRPPRGARKVGEVGPRSPAGPSCAGRQMTLPPWAVEFLRRALAAPGHKALLCCGRKNAKSAYGSTGPEISSHRASSRPGPGIPTRLAAVGPFVPAAAAAIRGEVDGAVVGGEGQARDGGPAGPGLHRLPAAVEVDGALDAVRRTRRRRRARPRANQVGRVLAAAKAHRGRLKAERALQPNGGDDLPEALAAAFEAERGRS